MNHEYGLKQITLDDTGAFFPQIDDDLIVWIATWDSYNHSRVMGYDIQADRLIEISPEGEDIYGRAFLSNGKVLYNTPTDVYNYTLWNSLTEESEQTDFGVSGSKSVKAFADGWVVFHHSFDEPSVRAVLSAFNVQTGQLMQVHLFPPAGEDSFERLGTTFTANGVLYYSVTVKENGNEAFSRLYQVDLTDGLRHEIFSGQKLAMIGELYVWEDQIAIRWGNRTNSTVVIFDEAGDLRPVSQWDGYISSSGGGWIALLDHIPYRVVDGEVMPIMFQVSAYNAATHEYHSLVKGNGDPKNGAIAPGNIGTDGTRFVVEILRATTEVFETVGSDLYWGYLPNAD